MLINEIEQLRSKIDSIDDEILSLIAQRRDCAVKIGALKDKLRASSNENKLGAYDSKRETQILNRLKDSSELSAYTVEAVFREIISFCRNSAHKSVICVFADDMRFVEAAKEHFGKSCDYKCLSNEKELLEALLESPFNIAMVSDNLSAETIEKMQNSGYIQNDEISVFLGKDKAKALVFAHK